MTDAEFPIRTFANVSSSTPQHAPLNKNVTAHELSRLRSDLCRIISLAGSVNGNEAFGHIAKLVLVKLYDEQTTPKGHEYQVQCVNTDTALQLVERLNGLYADAERAFLAVARQRTAPAFDPSNIPAETIVALVRRLQRYSLSLHDPHGNLLGEFFEELVAFEFTQTKGQFFTPLGIVRFMLELSDAVQEGRHCSKTKGTGQTVPYRVIDPSCGAGNFLIEYLRQSNSKRDIPFNTTLVGIESSHDLALAAKINMVLHGSEDCQALVASGLAPFDRPPGGQHTDLSLPFRSAMFRSDQSALQNGQFDCVLSNPPFSLHLSAEDKVTLAQSLSQLSTGTSEALFLERWSQLLRPGGKFCCIIPESLLDTGRNLRERLFLLGHFKTKAIISLPYHAFQPYTSTKTAIVFAEKRTYAETEAWQQTIGGSSGVSLAADEILNALTELDWADEEIFMAEPREVGYKRRKGLSDLARPNDLMDCDAGNSMTVLARWRDPLMEAHPTLGFRTSLRSISARSGLRLDPKYRWLWDVQGGHVFGSADEAQPLRTLLRLAPLKKQRKGRLQNQTEVIDLQHVESGQAFLAGSIPKLDEIESDKVSVKGAELLFSKLEPHLGKVVMSPPQSALGSTEWIGFTRISDIPLNTLAYTLLLPELREAYRRLQAGKRQARLDPEELLDLRVRITRNQALDRILTGKRNGILAARAVEQELRESIDQALRCS